MLATFEDYLDVLAGDELPPPFVIDPPDLANGLDGPAGRRAGGS